jgi:hypothetical protein
VGGVSILRAGGRGENGPILFGMEWIGDLERAFAASIYPNRVAVAIVIAVVLVVLVIVAVRRGWFAAARRHPARTGLAGLLAMAILVPSGGSLASPLVLSSTIDEPAPVVAGAATPGPAAAPTLRPTPSAAARPTPTPAATPSPSPTPMPIALAGMFSGEDEFHFGRGTARLIETAPGMFVVRLEDFAVRNGPDLYVYLSPDASGYAGEVVELGRLKADKGNQNYEVPDGFDASTAASVVIWCKQFAVQFAVAPLT